MSEALQSRSLILSKSDFHDLHCISPFFVVLGPDFPGQADNVYVGLAVIIGATEFR